MQTAEKHSAFNTLGDLSSKPLIGTLSTSQMGIVRVGFGKDHAPLRVEVEPQDSFYVMFQLLDHPSHEFWTGGRAAPAPASPRGSVHIADLGMEASARIVDRFDSLNLVIPRNFLDELAADVEARSISSLAVPEAWTTRDNVLSQMAPLLVSVLAKGAECGPLFADHLVLTIGLHIAERYGNLHCRQASPKGLTTWQERRAREMIAANLTKDMTLAEIASECRLSLAHFSRGFKASVGMTPHAWLQARRIELSKSLLGKSTMTFAEIAVRCGFADQSHFTRTFKRATGSTPAVWRRSLLG
jgi:AraC family transcriptional regulator